MCVSRSSPLISAIFAISTSPSYPLHPIHPYLSSTQDDTSLLQEVLLPQEKENKIRKRLSHLLSLLILPPHSSLLTLHSSLFWPESFSESSSASNFIHLPSTFTSTVGSIPFTTFTTSVIASISIPLTI